MRFAGTKRNTYTKEHVNKLRQKRKQMTPKREGVSQGGLDMMLGDLKAAGHLMINGFKSMGVNHSRVAPTSPLNKGSYTFEFDCYSEDGFGERPHLQGYLESASNADKRPYRIKGWFNPDGSIRIELVK